MKFLFLFLLLFLTGCTSYNTLRHETFSMKIPSWEDSSMQQTAGMTNGFFSANKNCSFNLTINSNTHLQVAYPFFERLRALDPALLLDYEIFVSSVVLHYRLADRLGNVYIITCPSGVTYFTDFSCTEKTYDSYTSIIQTSFDSMTC